LTEKESEYVVLARKYRPKDFSDLRGQEALVRTLSNAINSGRLAQSFMLTGVRGIGKTSTARIIAKALNCEKGPTVSPCGECEQCRAIAEDRSMDVLELDAASRNGVDEIRELIDSVQYAPVSGRYKIFILDEVHMLSKPAFNALLKTLEEPPAHVKFIFATTEINKVPVTVLSRCQRFDLRRMDANILTGLYTDILAKEGREAEEEAVKLIARAADGSARDGLSLLDQAISYEPNKITEEQVRKMLGMVDRTITLDLFEHIHAGESEKALRLLDELYKSGSESLRVLQDLIDLTHFITKVKVVPEVASDISIPEAERVRGIELANKLSVPVLTRTWQMLLKGVSEVQYAFNPQLALEMLIIRLIYVSEQPTPGDLLKKMQNGGSVSAGGGAPKGSGGSGSGNVTAFSTMPMAFAVSEVEAVAAINSFEQAVALFSTKKEKILESQIRKFVHLVSFKPGHIEIRLKEGHAQNLVGEMSKRLNEWTEQRWIISTSRAEGMPTLDEQEKTAANSLLEEIKNHPVVSEVLSVFPGANILEINNKTQEEE